MDEFGVFEGFAVLADKGADYHRWVSIRELPHGVSIEVNSGAVLSPDQARRLASRLYRLARRVETRSA